jgi:hypothetical protein
VCLIQASSNKLSKAQEATNKRVSSADVVGDLLKSLAKSYH